MYTIARTASEQVTLNLIKALSPWPCMPRLLSDLEACRIGIMVMNSLNLAVKRFLFKIFRVNSDDI